MVKEDCIFCKIGQHKAESSIVYETDDVIAFDDLSPQAPVHVLVIPKEHVDSVGDKNLSDDLLLKVFRAANKVAEIKKLDKSGYRLITNNGSDAGQTVPHFHVHVLGGTTFDEGLV